MENHNACPYCGKIFSTKHNLKVHTTTAVYCRKLRNDVSKTEDIQKQCTHCEKTFTSKQTLLYHSRICKKALIFTLREHHQKELNAMQDIIDQLRCKVNHLESKLREKTVFHLA